MNKMPARPRTQPDDVWAAMPSNRRRLALTGIGAVVGWGLYNLYLAPSAEAVNPMVRSIVVMLALAMAAGGFITRRWVGCGTAILVMMAMATLMPASHGIVMGLAVGAALAWTASRCWTGSDRRASITALGFALVLSANWLTAVVAALALRVDPAVLQQTLQALIVPIAAWLAWRMWRRRENRPWGLILWGLTMQLGVSAVLSIQKVAAEASAVGVG